MVTATLVTIDSEQRIIARDDRDLILPALAMACRSDWDVHIAIENINDADMRVSVVVHPENRIRYRGERIILDQLPPETMQPFDDESSQSASGFLCEDDLPEDSAAGARDCSFASYRLKIGDTETISISSSAVSSPMSRQYSALFISVDEVRSSITCMSCRNVQRCASQHRNYTSALKR